jgi:hypothetical protein
MSEAALTEWLGEVSLDPLGFVYGAYPWGEPDSPLESDTGPEPWQAGVLTRLGQRLTENVSIHKAVAMAVQEATASGHGVGKTALVCWIIHWGLSTFPHTRGVVTANTETQLKSKTWAELGKWHTMFIAKSLFEFTATAVYYKGGSVEDEKTWRIDMVPWSERNTEAFAGLHNQGRRIIVIFDEASAIPNLIWETTEGALTDANTQIIWCVFGNPTRNTGRFRECAPGGRFGKYWHFNRVDSRTVSFTNKEQIARWIEAYGDDSDFVRIRVKGEFPRTGEMEFFNAAEVEEAMVRDAHSDPLAPLALGVDVARFGVNYSVIFPRKGRDARSIPRERFQGLSTVELAQKVNDTNTRLHADGIMIDGGGVGGGVVDNVRHMRLFCYEVQFGAKNTISDIEGLGEKYANLRAGMYGALRRWLKTGAIPNDPDIKQQLLSITYTLNPRDEIILTSKEVMMREGKASPDDIDGLACTFAFPLNRNEVRGGQEGPRESLVRSEYDPYSAEWMQSEHSEAA